jgi:O-antigen ligase
MPEAGGQQRGAVAFWILAGVVVTVPLAVVPGLLLFDVNPKLLVIVPGACLVWLALALEGRLAGGRRLPAWFAWPLAGLGAAAILATIFSRDLVLSLAGSEWRRMGLPAWLACLALAGSVPLVVGDDRRRRQFLLAAMALTGVVAAAYSFAQYAGWDPLIPAALFRIGEGGAIVRPPASFGHPDYFAVFAVLAGFAAAGMAFAARALWARTGWALAAAVLAGGLLLTGSRGGWLGAAAGLALLAGSLPRRRALLAGLLVLTALAALFVVSPAGRPVRNRLLSFSSDPGAPARLPLWRDSLRLARDHWLLGTGPDNFQLVFPPYESFDLAGRAPDHYAESPHNAFLDYATAAGMPALLAFVVLVGAALRSGWRRRRESALEASLLAGLAGGLAASQFLADTIATRLALLVFVGLLACRCNDSSRAARVSERVPRSAAGAPSSAHVPLLRHPLPYGRGSVAVAAAAVAALGAALYFGGRLAYADWQGMQAARAVAAGKLAEAAAAERAAQRAFPWTGTYALAYSRSLGMLVIRGGEGLPPRPLLLDAAEVAAREALPHSSKPQIVLVHLASLHVLEGRLREAEEELRAAARAAPSWYRPRYLLAALLAEQRRYGEAAEHAAAALERGARVHPEIAARCRHIVLMK